MNRTTNSGANCIEVDPLATIYIKLRICIDLFSVNSHNYTYIYADQIINYIKSTDCPSHYQSQSIINLVL